MLNRKNTEKRGFMKKLLAIMLVLTVIMTACGAPQKESKNDEAIKKTQEITKSKDEESTLTSKKAEVKNNMSKDTTWNIVDQLELKVDSVRLSEDKKYYIVKYTYNNIGAKSEDGKEQDLLLEPSFVMDKEGNTLEKITSFKTENNPKPIKKGEVCKGAELAYEIIDESDILKIEFGYATSDGALQKVTFELPVE